MVTSVRQTHGAVPCIHDGEIRDARIWLDGEVDILAMLVVQRRDKDGSMLGRMRHDIAVVAVGVRGVA